MQLESAKVTCQSFKRGCNRFDVSVMIVSGRETLCFHHVGVARRSKEGWMCEEIEEIHRRVDPRKSGDNKKKTCWRRSLCK